MKIRNIMLGLAASGLLLSSRAVAIPIGGEISFSGSYTVDNPALDLATQFTGFSTVAVANGPTGNYAGTAGTAVTMTPFTFDPFSAAVTPQWLFTFGGNTYSFDLTYVSVSAEGASYLVLEGSGMAHITGFEDTPGLWNLTANTLGSTFSFSSTSKTAGIDRIETVTSVPDSGATASLLGLGLAAMSAVGRFARPRQV